MRFWSALTSLVLALCCTTAWSASALSAANQPRPGASNIPSHPRLLEASQAPQTARILRQVSLTYAAGMSEREREIDFLQKVRLAKRLLGVGRLVELRHQTLKLVAPGQVVS